MKSQNSSSEGWTLKTHKWLFHVWPKTWNSHERKQLCRLHIVIPPGAVSPAHGDQNIGARRAPGDPASLTPQQRVVAVQRWPQPVGAQQHLLLVRGARPVQHGHLHRPHDPGKTSRWSYTNKCNVRAPDVWNNRNKNKVEAENSWLWLNNWNSLLF